jgi:hypothetical protein
MMGDLKFGVDTGVHTNSVQTTGVTNFEIAACHWF